MEEENILSLLLSCCYLRSCFISVSVIFLQCAFFHFCITVLSCCIFIPPKLFMVVIRWVFIVAVVMVVDLVLNLSVGRLIT